MKTIKHLLTIVYLFFCNTCIYSQIPQAPMSALSPNAASLGIYGDIPVSHYMGVPEVTIPLYDLRVKDFVLPITLSYHAAGIQVDQRAGWTGVNWTLFAGGVITRRVNGNRADDWKNNNYVYEKDAGFYFNHNNLNTSSWNQRSYLVSIVSDVNKQWLDYAPDEFSFSFHGYNGKFYLDHNRNWMVQCDKPVIVEFDNVFFDVPFSTTRTRSADFGYSQCFCGFTITVEDGTKYYFGKDINAIDFSIDFFEQYKADWIATAWYLTKIVLPNKHEINLSYQRNEFTNQMYIAVNRNIDSRLKYNDVFGNSRQCSSIFPFNSYYEGQLLSPVYLSEIVTDNTIVSFNRRYSAQLGYDKSIYYYKYDEWYNGGRLMYPDEEYFGQYHFLPVLGSQNYSLSSNDYRAPLNCLNKMSWYRLNDMVIKDKQRGETLKTVNFFYNNSSNERLFLDSITESGKNSYIFSYFEREKLPPYLANKSDHWGYFNNREASFDNTMSSYENYYNLRESNGSVLKYGILRKITYPTGGYTEFEFESNTYSKQLNVERWKPIITLSLNKTAGGLRIKRIRSSGLAQGVPDYTKEYYYVSDYLKYGVNAEISSGVIGGQIQYLFKDYITYEFNNGAKVAIKIDNFSSISALPSCYNANGCHIGYTEVIEKYQDNSFTRYSFTNFDNGYMDEAPEVTLQETRIPYELYNSKSQERAFTITRRL